jgi:hypothetical protein
MRWLTICLGCLLTACNEVTGNESGGVISGQAVSLDWLTEKLKTFGFEMMTDEDALQKAISHCGRYRKRARITSVASGKTLFECL